MLELEKATAAGGEKKGGATSAIEGVMGQRQFPSPDSRFIPNSHVLCVSLGCMLLDYSLSTKRLEDFLQESKDNK